MLTDRQVDLPPQNPPWRTRFLMSKPLKVKGLVTFVTKIHLPFGTALLDITTSGQLNISNRSHSAHSGPYGWPYGVLIHPMNRLHSHIVGLIRAGLPEIRSHTQVGHWQPSRYGGRQTWWWRRVVVRPLHSLTSASPVPPLARVIRYGTWGNSHVIGLDCDRR